LMLNEYADLTFEEYEGLAAAFQWTKQNKHMKQKKNTWSKTKQTHEAKQNKEWLTLFQRASESFVGSFNFHS
jgi:glycine betaine/choline ABC-type transport system substrate-binding protein